MQINADQTKPSYFFYRRVSAFIRGPRPCRAFFRLLESWNAGAAGFEFFEQQSEPGGSVRFSAEAELVIGGGELVDQHAGFSGQGGGELARREPGWLLKTAAAQNIQHAGIEQRGVARGSPAIPHAPHAMQHAQSSPGTRAAKHGANHEPYQNQQARTMLREPSARLRLPLRGRFDPTIEPVHTEAAAGSLQPVGEDQLAVQIVAQHPILPKTL